MITDDYVSFEIAQLLKEKGFDWQQSPFYSEQDMDGWKQENSYTVQNPDYDPDIPFDSKTITMVAPHISQSLALKWLREVHKIHIDVFIGSDESYDADGVMVDEWHFWTYYITNTSGDMIYDAYNGVDIIEHQTHEEAVEAALFYVLKNLIY